MKWHTEIPASCELHANLAPPPQKSLLILQSCGQHDCYLTTAQMLQLFPIDFHYHFYLDMYIESWCNFSLWSYLRSCGSCRDSNLFSSSYNTSNSGQLSFAVSLLQIPSWKVTSFNSQIKYDYTSETIWDRSINLVAYRPDYKFYLAATISWLTKTKPALPLHLKIEGQTVSSVLLGKALAEAYMAHA